MKKRIISMLCAAVMLTSATVLSAAAAPYEAYNYDSWGEAVPSQAGYEPEKAVSGHDIGVGALNSPGDIFRAQDGTFYIADTGNNRIIAADSELTEAIGVYDVFTASDGSTTTLSNPGGVFVSGSGIIYIADSDNDRVLISDKDANVIAELKRPDSELFTAPTFKPLRVIADKAGSVYVVLGNITSGAAMFLADGSFSGFYGANRVEPTAETIRNYISGLFMSEEKRRRRKRSVPSGISGFDIDGDFIFTCSSSSTQQTDTVKKLGAAGNNIFANKELRFGDYAPMYDTSHNQLLASSIIDIDIDDDGCINCLDLTAGRIFRYDEEGELMFIVGTKAEQLGGFTTVSAIESGGGKLYVTDSAKNTITVFRQTYFGSTVNRAVALFNEGRYEEALEPWYEVLSRDGNYRRAHIGIASALLRQGYYKGAMKYARLADSPKLYNKAFEGYRREFIRGNFPILLISAAALAVFAGTLARVLRRKKRRADN